MSHCEGSFRALFLYDVADEIRLEELRRLVGAGPPGREPGFKLAAPDYVRFERPPVEVPSDPVRLAGGECFETRIKYFDYGVISVHFETPFRGGWEDVVALSSRWIEAPELENRALEAARWHIERVRPAIGKPYSDWLDEAYYVIHLAEAHDDDGRVLSASDLLFRHGRTLAQIVRGEVAPLSEAEQREVLQSSMSFYPSDLLVVGWLAALIYDTPEGAAPTLQLLEYANSQLLEYRRYDELLSEILTRAYDALERRRGFLARWRLAREAERLNALRLELTELTERTDNAIKFLSDMFYARAYQLAAAKVGVNDYRRLVEAKLRTAGELYQFMINEFHHARAFVLELMIVIILLIDLYYLFRGK